MVSWQFLGRDIERKEKMSININGVTENTQSYQTSQKTNSASSGEESSSFSNILLSAISRCFADAIASYKEKVEAEEKTRAQASSGDTAGTTFQMSESMDAIFQEAADTYGVPVNLLKAVGMVESNFNQYAQSAAGAQGVMQLMPSTAASLGVTDPFDARQNIMGGAKLLAQNLDMYNGDVDLALAAYNAGPGNVDAYGGVPPFPETQNYVATVKEYMGSELSTGQNVQTTVESADSTGQGTSGSSTAEEDTEVPGLNFLVDAVERAKVQTQMV